MIIDLETAYKILEDCAAIGVDDGYVLYPKLACLNGSPYNEFVCFFWEDDCDQEYLVTCNEGDNRLVQLHESLLTLIDTDGNEFQAWLLGPYNAEKALAHDPNNNA